MKCPNCDGTGKVKLDSGIFTWVSMCDQCGGSGIIDPQTNEEWLKHCNTEQLAEVITDIVYECKDQDDCMDCKLGWCSPNYVAKWLKEIHK